MSYHDFEITEPTLFGRPLISDNTHVIDPNRPYVVKGLLMASQVSVLCGPPNRGKSCVAASVSAHVSMGRELGGLKVERTLVVYIAAEDAKGILDRAHPFLRSAPGDTAPFHVYDKAVDLTDNAAIEELCAGLIELARKARANRIHRLRYPELLHRAERREQRGRHGARDGERPVDRRDHRRARHSN